MEGETTITSLQTTEDTTEDHQETRDIPTFTTEIVIAPIVSTQAHKVATKDSHINLNSKMTTATKTSISIKEIRAQTCSRRGLRDTCSRRADNSKRIITIFISRMQCHRWLAEALPWWTNTIAINRIISTNLMKKCIRRGATRIPDQKAEIQSRESEVVRDRKIREGQRVRRMTNAAACHVSTMDTMQKSSMEWATKGMKETDAITTRNPQETTPVAGSTEMIQETTLAITAQGHHIKKEMTNITANMIITICPSSNHTSAKGKTTMSRTADHGMSRASAPMRVSISPRNADLMMREIDEVRIQQGVARMMQEKTRMAEMKSIITQAATSKVW